VSQQRGTIVMIHGMWVGSDCWKRYKHLFEERDYECLTPTLRYHDIDPSSEPPEDLGTYSLLEYAHDLEKYVRSLDTRPILVGHSMGGLLAQILAARGLSDQVVLLAPAPPSSVNGARWSVIRSLIGIFARWGFWKRPNRISFKKAEYAFLHNLPAEERKEAYATLVYESGRALAEISAPFLDRQHASQVDESKVSYPVLVVGGSLDRITPASVARSVAKKYGAVSTYKEFEGHSHWILAEDGWEDVADYVAEWLEATGPSGAQTP